MTTTTLGSLYGHSRRVVSQMTSAAAGAGGGGSSSRDDAHNGSSSSSNPASPTTPNAQSNSSDPFAAALAASATEIAPPPLPKAPPPPVLRHNVLLAGLRRSGKTSIIKVVHNHVSPSDTLFLESNSAGAKGRWTTQDVDGLLALRIWDGPGISATAPIHTTSGGAGGGAGGRGADQAGLGQADDEAIAAEVKEGKLRWKDVGCVIFVIDAQDDYFDAISRLHELVVRAFAINPLIEFHIFVHKVDGLSDDYKFDTQRDIEQRLLDELADASASFAFAPGAREMLQQKMSAEAFGAAAAAAAASGGVGASKSFGGHVVSATASPRIGSLPPSSGRSPAGASATDDFFPLETHVRLHFHLTSIFDNSIFVAISRVTQSLLEPDVVQSLEMTCDSICASCRFDKAFLVDVHSRAFMSSDSTPFDPASFDMISEYLNFLLLFSDVYKDLQAKPPSAGASGTLSTSASSTSLASTAAHATSSTVTAAAATGPSTNEGQEKVGRYATSTCRLAPDLSISFWQLDGRLALIAILKSEVQSRNAGLIDYNVSFFRRAIVQIAQVVRNTQLGDAAPA